MQFSGIEVDRDEARKRVEEFTARRRKRLTEMDQALYRGYKALAEGLTVIDVNKVISEGGQFEDNYCPKLALARSDLKTVYFRHSQTYENDPRGQLTGWLTSIHPHESERNRDQIWTKARTIAGQREIGTYDYLHEAGLRIELEPGTLNQPEELTHIGRRRWFKAEYKATVPEIPFHLRPNGDAENYFILWEVEKWEELWRRPITPGDPLLLERIAHPIYVVVAQWDLTELEKRILESFRRER